MTPSDLSWVLGGHQPASQCLHFALCSLHFVFCSFQFADGEIWGRLICNSIKSVDKRERSSVSAMRSPHYWVLVLALLAVLVCCCCMCRSRSREGRGEGRGQGHLQHVSSTHTSTTHQTSVVFHSSKLLVINIILTWSIYNIKCCIYNTVYVTNRIQRGNF